MQLKNQDKDKAERRKAMFRSMVDPGKEEAKDEPEKTPEPEKQPEPVKQVTPEKTEKSPEPAAKPVQKTRGRPKGSKNKPKATKGWSWNKKLKKWWIV